MATTSPGTCSSCDAAVPAGARFCPRCGAFVRDAGAGASPEANEPAPGAPPESPLDREIELPRPDGMEPAPSGGPGRGAVITAAGIFLLAGLVYGLFFHTSGDSTIPEVGEPLTTPTMPQAGMPGANEPRRAAPSPTVEHRVERSVERGEATRPQAPSEQEESPAQHADEREPRGRSAEDARAERPASGTLDRRARGWYRLRYQTPLFREPRETAEISRQLPSGIRVYATGAVGAFLAIESTTGKEPGYIATDDAERERGE